VQANFYQHIKQIGKNKMIDIITKSGKKLGKISDSLDQDDTIIVDGKPIRLSDAYSDEELRKQFNKNVKELKDATGQNTDS
jgi:hypothetical protein